MKKSVGRGRRPGQPETRELIRQAARERFMADGYEGASLRSIAAHGGVDVALLSYYFGSKRDLFAAAMSLDINPADIVEAVLAGDPATLPERMLRGMLALWDEPASGEPLRTVLREAAGDAAMSRLAAEMIEHEIIRPVAHAIGGEQALQRATAACTQMGGILLTRYLLRIEPIASMTPDEIVQAIEPSLTVALGMTTA
jgi:AcrR family transcriptional regulator